MVKITRAQRRFLEQLVAAPMDSTLLAVALYGDRVYVGSAERLGRLCWAAGLVKQVDWHDRRRSTWEITAAGRDALA